MEKKCSKCGEVKAFELFYGNKHQPDGKCLGCKECERKYRIKNKEKINLADRNRYANTIEAQRLRGKKYRLSHVGERMLYRKKYEEENRDMLKRKDRLSTLNMDDKYINKNLKRRNLPVTEVTMQYNRNTIQIHRLLKELK